METIHFQKLADAPAFTDGYSLIANSVANDGALLFLSIEQAGKTAVRETCARRFCLSIMKSDSHLDTIELPELNVTFPLVDIFPNGKILIVGPRCSWRGENNYDLNGAIFDPQTDRVSRILLGDGINRAYVDAIGRIWVAYGDEGIFGNFGWGGPGPTPVGSAGLVCFSEEGKKIWEYSADAGGMMADCYALNVSGAEAAIYFYTDFPICRISSDFKLQYWKTKVCGCHEFAISERTVLFSGQYSDPPDIGYLGRFETGELADTHQVRLSLPDGSGLPKGQFLGRGRHLYFFDTLSVYRASLD